MPKLLICIMNATISADIISSTSLSSSQLMVVVSEVRALFQQIEKQLNNREMLFWGRIVKGDTMECYLKEPHYALRIALLLKTTVLTVPVKYNKSSHSVLFKKYGVRMAIGIGDMRIVDKGKDIMDGTAIYLSGRKIAEQTTNGKQKNMVKRTLYFACQDALLERQLNVYLSFVDQLLRLATTRQIQVLQQKLMGYTDKVAATNLALKSASTVNQHCTTLGWNAIDGLLNYYEQELFPL